MEGDEEKKAPDDAPPPLIHCLAAGEPSSRNQQNEQRSPKDGDFTSQYTRKGNDGQSEEARSGRPMGGQGLSCGGEGLRAVDIDCYYWPIP